MLILGMLVSSFVEPLPIVAAENNSTENEAIYTTAEATVEAAVYEAAVYEAAALTFAPGQNATELNFAWYSNVLAAASAVQVAEKSAMIGDEFPVDAATTFTGTVSPAVSGCYSNKVIVTGLAQSTKYIYRVGDGSEENWSPVYEFTTNGTDSFSCLVVGDVQIGAGNTSTDILGWRNTMTKAVGQFPEASFLLSLGDQVETSSNENEYTGFFSPTELRNLPVAPLLGNHDNGSANYGYHFNLPNLSTEYGITHPGSSDYYFTYGNALFMVLNSNNTSCASHEAFIQETVEENPDAVWKVVMFHHDIYGSASHSLESGIIALRQGLYPVFDKYNINLVLNGHDHSYTRTYMMYGDQPLPGQNVIGTLIMTLNSASGSKYYNLQPTPETYAAVRDQIKVPTFSKIDVTPDTLTISTYRTDTMAMTDTYTIGKQAQESLDLAQVTMTADSNTLDSENPAASVALNVAAEDSEGTAVGLSGAYILYQTDAPDIVTIEKDGTDGTIGHVTIKNAPAMNETVNVWAKVFDGNGFVESNEVEIQVTVPYGLAGVSLSADRDSISATSPVIQLSVTGIDTLGAAMDISSATIVYNTDKADILAVSEDGVVTVQNSPERNKIVKITAEATVDKKTITSNEVSITVMKAGAGSQIAAPVKNALDDMEEWADGSLDLDSSDLEITWEKPTKEDVKNQLIGIRFAGLEIPQGATITDAYIQFSVDEPDKSFNPFNVDIYAEDVADSAAFENVNGFVSGKFANKTAASVKWKDIPMWTVEHEADSAQQTPNLASLVQEIVNKDGWNKGNAISFLFSGIGNRTAESFEGAGDNVDQIPTLHVIYTVEEFDIPAKDESVPKNVILLIGDGMGFEHVEAARDAAGGNLSMDKVNDAAGQMTTHSANADITDSSSAATAMAAGYKINNNVLGLLPDGTSVPTILELAEDKGLATGLVTTVQIAHATPAGFASHVPHRNQFNKIAAQYFDNFAAKGNPIEALMGGGQENFDNRAAYYDRTGKKYDDANDTRDLLGEFTAQGYQYAGNAGALGSVSAAACDKLLGLFHPNNGLAQEVDRPEGCTEPHLVDMTGKALEILANDSDGFFIMVEGGQIDWASHANDFDNNIGETLAFDDAVEAALEFQAVHPDTLIIVTADHECGGLTYNGPDDYSWSSIDHTAAMVPVMAEGPGAELFNGTIDNTDIARKIAQLLSLDKPLTLQYSGAVAGVPTEFTATSMGLAVDDAKIAVKKGINNTLATLTTNSSGKASYTFKDAGDYSVYVSKDGYSDSDLIPLNIGVAAAGATISNLSVLDGNQNPVNGALTHGKQYYLKWTGRKNSDGNLSGMAIVEALYGSQPVFLNAANLQVAGGQDTGYSVLFQPASSGNYTLKGLYWNGWSNNAAWQSLADPVESSITVN